MKKTFDLTQSQNLKNQLINNFGVNWIIESPFYEILEIILSLFSNKDQIKAQKEAAKEIIKIGEEQNVDELEIILNQEAGIKLKGEIKDLNANVDFRIGQEGNMIIKVKYK